MDDKKLDMGVLLLWCLYAYHIWWAIFYAKQT